MSTETNKQDKQETPSAIGKYKLLAELGSGGMAHVFLAVTGGPSGFSKLLVLKILKKALAEEPESVQMFLNEARLAGRLNHPNVVQTYEAGEMDGNYVLVMEYLDGQALSSTLRRLYKEENTTKPCLPILLRVVIESLYGLSYAHEAKDFDGTPLSLVHRDVSPQNIFVTYDGQVKVLDFGIAKAITSNNETRQGVMKGKIAYMAPEQFMADKIDRRADIYAMGVILWEVLAGRQLWDRTHGPRVMHDVLSGAVPTPSSVSPDVPPELERICLKALSRLPEDRYSTAEEMYRELEAALATFNTNVDSRAVGNFVAQMFADRRKTFGELVDAQLKAVSALTTGEFKKNAAPIPSAATATMTFSNWGGPAMPHSTGRGASSVIGTSGPFKNTHVSAGIEIRDSGETRPKARVKRFVVVGLLTTILAAGAFVLATRVGKKQTSVQLQAESQSAVSTAIAMGSPAKTDAAREVAIEITTHPKQARIFVDERFVEGDPAVRRLPADGAVHRVRVEAEGYRMQTIEFVADKDRVVSVSLDKASPATSSPQFPRGAGRGAGAAGRAAHAGPATNAAQPSGPVSEEPKKTQPHPGQKKERKVDVSNPWE